jgi:hypothetical protein
LIDIGAVILIPALQAFIQYAILIPRDDSDIYDEINLEFDNPEGMILI